MSTDKAPKKSAASEPTRSVLCEVVQRGGVKLPGTNHRLGRGHRLPLTQEEADAAKSAGIVRVVGIV